MNPFDLRGPQFLLFFALLSGITIFIARYLRRRRELEQGGEVARLHDPYAIAYLRGGKNELIRVAVVSLVDRRLLGSGGETVVTTPLGKQTEVRKPIERELLQYCTTARKAPELFGSSQLGVAAAGYAYELETNGLLPDDEMKRQRLPVFLVAISILLAASITKIVVALQRGRANVGFLLGFTVVAIIILAIVVLPRLTARGKQHLAELRNVFDSLKLRAATLRPGGADADLVLAAAVFGVNVLPSHEFEWARLLFPKAQSSSCGSSCGSSGCGGGGCGGGCGGCGG